MQGPTSATRTRRWPLVAGILLGASLLTALSLFQKSQLGVPVLNPAGYVVPVAYGGTAGLIVSIVYERLYQSRETLAEFQRAVDVAGQAVLLIDGDETIQYANAALEEMSGYDADELVGSTVGKLGFEPTPDSDRDSVPPGSVLTGQWEGEVVCTGMRGDRFFAWMTVAPVEGTDSERTIAILSDVTDRSIREQQLSVLHRIIRHNLRNELTVIEGRGQMLEQTVENPRAKTMAAEIRSRAGTLAQLSRKVSMIRGALDPRTRSTADRPVGSLVQTTVDDLQEEYPGADIQAVVRDPDLRIDSILGVALAELVRNGVQHADHDTPSITVSTETRGDGSLVLTVTDDGPGIPDSEQAPLTGDIETDLDHGSGLGLWVVYWATVYCGGTVEIDADRETGTEISITVPCRSGNTDCSGRQQTSAES